jgi:hypothetical protein
LKVEKHDHLLSVVLAEVAEYIVRGLLHAAVGPSMESGLAAPGAKEGSIPGKE